MAEKKQTEGEQTSDDEYDAQKPADDRSSRRGERRSSRRQVRIDADAAGLGDQVASPESKDSTLVMSVGKRKHGRKPEIGSKGEVRYTEDFDFEFYDPKSGQWVPAAYHNDHRQEFIEGDAPQDGFDWAPRRGFAAFDETSHMEVQRPWSGDHLEGIVDPAGKKVMFDVERPKLPRPADPGNWVHDGNVLLDHNNHPVKAWTDLNKTLSTELEDWRLEAIRRLYWWLTMDDILARMPHFRQKIEGGDFVPLQSSRAFTNRAMRFRQPKAIIPTNQRKGTTTIVEYIRSHLDKHHAETAEEVPQLTRAQLKKAKKANKGKFSMNSRYINQSKNASKSGNTKRKVGEDYGDSDEENTESRAKRAKKEVNLPPTDQSNAPMPTPHGWRERNRSISHNDQLASQGFSDPEMAHWVPFSQADEDEKPLIPLFVSLECEELAAIQDARYTTPEIVLEARANGCTMLAEVEIRWYPEDVEREANDRGREHEYVVIRGEFKRCDLNDDNEHDDVPPPQTAPVIAQPLLPTPTQAPAPAPAAPQTTIQDEHTFFLGDEEGHLYENPWRHHYGPSGF